MNLKILFITLLVLTVSLGTYLIWSQFSSQTDNANTTVPIKQITIHRFTDESGNSVELSFNPEGKTVTVTGNGYIGLVFRQTISASGERYENTENSLVLWNKGDEVTIYQADEIVFVGTIKPMEAIKTPEITDNNPSEINAANPELYTSSWVWVRTELLSGETIMAPDNQAFILSFDGNGYVSSQTDCNSLGGIYSVDGEVLSIGQLVSTLMYCEDSMEAVYSEQLGLVNSYVIEEDILRLNLDSDYGVMTFVRASD